MVCAYNFANGKNCRTVRVPVVPMRLRRLVDPENQPPDIHPCRSILAHYPFLLAVFIVVVFAMFICVMQFMSLTYENSTVAQLFSALILQDYSERIFFANR